MEPLRDTVVTLGYSGATRRYYSDTRVLLEKCGPIKSGRVSGTSVVVPYCYLFLLSVFILWFSYYVNDIFCKFQVAE